MRTLKKSTALIISVCIVISALTCMLSATLPASANAAPQASYTYDFTDATKFTAGESIVPNIPGAILGNAIPTGNTVDANSFTVGNMDIYSDAAGTFGLGENSQFLKLGKLRTGNILSDKYADTKNYAEYVVLNHPNDKVITNPDGSKTLQQYPVTKMTLDVWLPNNNAQRGGIVASKGTKNITYDSENDLFTTVISYLVYGLQADATNGITFRFNHGGFKKLQIKPNSTDGIESITIADYIRPADYPLAYHGTSATTLGSLAIDANGNALSSDLVVVLNNYFAAKKSLTNAERWATIENCDGENGTHIKTCITLNFSDYAALRQANPTLPEKLTVRMPDVDRSKYDYNVGANKGFFSVFGFMTGSEAKYQSAAKSVTVEYDISSYYAEATEEFKTSFAANYATVVGSNGYFDQSDLTAIDALLGSYDALPQEVKDALADEVTLTEQLSTLRKAKSALEGGAYYFDSFDHGLNYKVISHINNVSKTFKIETGDPTTAGELGTTPTVDISDNLNETNVYSTEAASNVGDSNGNAFWGIHTDKNDANNNALWLRKSFNAYNMVPNKSGDRQTWPSVLYVLKDGIIPEGAEIEKITGKLYYYTTGDKFATGILNFFESEIRWDATTVTGKKLQKVSRMNATTANFPRNAPLKDANDVNVDYVETTYSTNQWLDFTFTYVEEKGVYEFSVTGKNKTDGTPTTLTAYSEAVTGAERVNMVGLFHGSPTNQAFDDIAVTLKQDETQETDIAPEVLGARILKQATDNNQNLRIDVDFTKAIAQSEKIAEYGVILQAGTQTKETLIDANNTTRTVLSYDPTVDAIPEKMIITIARSADNDGKRVTAIAYVKDSEGNYHYSNNNATNEAGQNIVTDGVANKSVIGVMKSWYSASSQSEAANIATAIAEYAEANEINADTVKSLVDGYVDGTYDTTSAEYETCKEYLRGVFYKYCSIFL